MAATRLVCRVPAADFQAIEGVVAVDVHCWPGDEVDCRTGRLEWA
jgi:hypothetical protein